MLSRPVKYYGISSDSAYSSQIFPMTMFDHLLVGDDCLALFGVKEGKCHYKLVKGSPKAWPQSIEFKEDIIESIIKGVVESKAHPPPLFQIKLTNQLEFPPIKVVDESLKEPLAREYFSKWEIFKIRNDKIYKFNTKLDVDKIIESIKPIVLTNDQIADLSREQEVFFEDFTILKV